MYILLYLFFKYLVHFKQCIRNESLFILYSYYDYKQYILGLFLIRNITIGIVLSLLIYTNN